MASFGFVLDDGSCVTDSGVPIPQLQGPVGEEEQPEPVASVTLDDMRIFCGNDKLDKPIYIGDFVVASRKQKPILCYVEAKKPSGIVCIPVHVGAAGKVMTKDGPRRTDRGHNLIKYPTTDTFTVKL